MLDALLLDLDDTLLTNSMDVFIPEYLARLGRHAAQRMAPQQAVDAVLAATRDMLTNTDPTLTNREVFWKRFCELTQLRARDSEEFFSAFYSQGYIELKSITKPVAASKELVQWARTAELQVVIATNPVYPLSGILARLDWAGLAGMQDEFALITSYENMHATKPHPHYYEEILERVGTSAERTLMVGDDVEADILPAQALGMHTFHVRAGLASAENTVESATQAAPAGPRHRAGTLDELLRVLRSGW